MGVVFSLRGRVFGLCQVITGKLLIAAALGVSTGCQYQAISVADLEIHQSLVDKAGLTAVHVDPALKITCTPPDQWDQVAPAHGFLYSHEQWRSPDHRVGMGVAFMRTPFPFSPQTIIWFAKSHYTEGKQNRGRVLEEWNDSLGRRWFDAENEEFHVHGYAMTRGCDAWLVYYGYRVGGEPPAEEIGLARKGAESVAPMGVDR